MKHYILIITTFFFLLACNNWNKDKLQPFPILELSKNEYNLTFGETHIRFSCILQDTIVIQNTGETPLIIDSVTSSEPLFFWVEKGRNPQIIPPNGSEKLIVSFSPHDYVTEYVGEIMLYGNHTKGIKKIPVKASFDCSYNGYSSCSLMNGGWNTTGNDGGGGGSIWCSGFSVPLNQWYYPPYTFSNCVYTKGFDIRIIAVDTTSGNLTIEWLQHSDIDYETATVKAILTVDGSNNQVFPYIEGIPITSNTNVAIFNFYLNPQEIKNTSIPLEFDTYKDGVHIVYYSPTIYMCI